MGGSLVYWIWADHWSIVYGRFIGLLYMGGSLVYCRRSIFIAWQEIAICKWQNCGDMNSAGNDLIKKMRDSSSVKVNNTGSHGIRIAAARDDNSYEISCSINFYLTVYWWYVGVRMSSPGPLSPQSRGMISYSSLTGFLYEKNSVSHKCPPLDWKLAKLP